MFGSKFFGEMSQSKNIQVGKSYGIGYEIKNLTEKTEIKTSDGNNLNAKGKALKSLTISITTVFILKFHSKQFHGEILSLKSPTFIGRLKLY